MPVSAKNLVKFCSVTSSDLLKGITRLILLQILFLSTLPKDLAPSPWLSAPRFQFRAWMGNHRLSSGL